jgi:hypothetical protein
MIFFTRRLYEGYQPESGWEQRALNEWKRNQEIYHRYAAVIAPLVPAAVTRFDQSGPHDAVVTSVDQQPGVLTIALDATNALGQFRGRQIRLTFSGVKKKIKTSGLVGHCWLFQEIHLSSRARFAMRVFFDKKEIEIEANRLEIKKTRYRKKSHSGARHTTRGVV